MKLSPRFRSPAHFGAGLAIAAVALTSVGAPATNGPVPDESTFVPVTPVRILDTRSNVGLDGQFVSGVPRDLQVTGQIPTSTGTAVVVPPGATGIVMNATAVSPTAAGFVSIRPADVVGAPTTSNLNVDAGLTVPNAVTVALPTSGADAGKIEIVYDAFGGPGRTHILVDVVGYTTAAGLGELDSRISTLDSEISTLESEVATLDSRIATLEVPSVLSAEVNSVGQKVGTGRTREKYESISHGGTKWIVQCVVDRW